MKYLHIKFDNSKKRFPAFWGPGHDWGPDHNHGGSGMILLQEMLMQCDGDDVRVLPTWDKTVDVSFKLFAPQGKIIECELRNGILNTNVVEVRPGSQRPLYLRERTLQYPDNFVSRVRSLQSLKSFGFSYLLVRQTSL